VWTAAAALAPATAQIAPRLTGAVALEELATARTALDAASPPLNAVRADLDTLDGQLRQALGGDTAKPVEIIGDGARAAVLRAHAAARRVQGFLAASAGCQGSDTAAMQASLAAGVAALAADRSVAKVMPVVDGIETMAQQPLFALHQGAAASVFALTGVNLADLQCANPLVTATGSDGALLPAQPVITGATPTRIELRWPGLASVPVGTVMLHVSSQHKVFLLGCSALPQASAALQVAAPQRLQVEYTLSARCEAGGAAAEQTLAHGTLPELVGQGATVSQAVDTSRCAEPQSYSVSAVVQGSDGSRTSAGPFTQSAQAAITAGLPGGLTLSWNPAAQMLVARSGNQACKGIE
jgi:hypothetical protein